jgi:hypothetical protein
MRGSRPACLYHDCLIERSSHAWKDWDWPSRLSSNFQSEVDSVQRVHHVRENVSPQSHVTCDDVWTFFLTARIFSSFDMTLFISPLISPQAEHKLYFIALWWFCNSSLNELYTFWRKIGLCYQLFEQNLYRCFSKDSTYSWMKNC